MTKTGHRLEKTGIRAVLVALAFMVASVSVLAQAGYAQTSPQPPGNNVVLVSPNSIKEGSALDCVYDGVRQGVPIDEALAGCDLGGKAWPDSPDDVGSALGFGGGTSSGPTVGSVSCSNGVNPQVSGGLDPYYPMPVAPQAPLDLGEGIRKDLPTYKELEKAADAAWENYYNAYKKYEGDPSPENLNDLAEAQKAAKEAVEKRDKWQPGLVEPTETAARSAVGGAANRRPTPKWSRGSPRSSAACTSNPRTLTRTLAPPSRWMPRCCAASRGPRQGFAEIRAR